ncbi:helix-turn-helix domain-containing protein [Budvicia aquatica]|uniref:helix-turn-helix domain-containing protein n=1 Tax=Budvicia aquatica TaxID=82979 RepID=UPI0021C256A3|nr:helix-turn-helix domain-containing protein [Budvicia aquatica]
MIAKPIESIKNIGEEVMSSSDSFSLHLKKNQRLDFNSFKDAIYYLEAGTISIFRLSDNVLTISVESPFVFGLTQLRNQYRYHYLRCEEESIVWGIDKGNAEKLFDNKGLWKFSSDILGYISNLYYHREQMTSKKSVNEIVVQHLGYIWGMPVEERSKTSVYSFILSRNHISRSAVHKVIHELVDSNYIAISRGKLVDMDTESVFKGN